MGLFDKLKFWKKDDDLLDAAMPEKNPFAEPLPNDPLQQANPFGPQSSDHLNSGHDDFADPFTAKKAFEQGAIKETPAVPSSSQGNDRFALMEKDLEILSSKMDAIKSTMDSMNQRLQHIEQIAVKEQQKPRW